MKVVIASASILFFLLGCNSREFKNDLERADLKGNYLLRTGVLGNHR
jgi:uncharacterized lipoprotein NlpE involved in copper resistance